MKAKFSIFVVVVAVLFSAVLFSNAYAASLTADQVNSILNLLKVFGAEQNVINNVESSLTGTASSGGGNSGGGSSGSVGSSGENSSGGGGSETLMPRPIFCFDIQTNLSYRSRDAETGGQVSLLQDYLSANGYFNQEPTGYYGLLTVAAVKKFQNAYGIAGASGYFGPTSRAKLKELTCGGTMPPIQIPSITVLSPKQGDIWHQGNPYSISWTPFHGDFDHYEVLLSNAVVPGVQGGLMPTQADKNINSITINGLDLSDNLIKTWVANSTFYKGTTDENLIRKNFFYTVRSVKDKPYGKTEIIQSATSGVFSILPSGINLPPVIDKISGPKNLKVGQTGTWEFSVHDPENTELSWNVDWGDTNKTYLGKSKGINGTASTHSYSKVGIYTITLIVTDDNGLATESSKVVTVDSSNSSSITVSSSSQPTNSLLFQNAKAAFTRFTVTAGAGADAVLNGVVVERVGIGSDNILSGLYLLEEIAGAQRGTQIGLIYSLDANHQATIGQPIIIPAGTQKTFTVYGNAACNLSSYAGSSIGLSVVGLNTSSVVSGWFPISGAIHTATTQVQPSEPSTQPCAISNPSITVLSPNGGETLIYGVKDVDFRITWTGVNLAGNVTAYLVFSDGTPCRLGSVSVDQRNYPVTLGPNYQCPNVPRSITSGQYKVRLIADGQSSTSDLGIYDDSDSYFTITSATSNLPPVIDGTSGPTSLKIGETGTWSVKARDPENGTLSYSVDWGDSVPRVYTTNGTVASPSVQQTSTFTHSYSAAGTYTVKFTVTDDKGLTAQSSVTVSVNTPEDAQRREAIRQLYLSLLDREPEQAGWDFWFSSNLTIEQIKSGIIGSSEYQNLHRASITVLSPNGGETWVKGLTQTIKWQDNTPEPPCSSTDNSVTVQCLKIARTYDVSLIGGYCPPGSNCPTYTPSYVIAKGLPNSNYTWKVGDTVSGSFEGSYKVRVCQSGTNTCDMSDSYFTITSGTSTNLPPVIDGTSGPTILNVGQTGTWTVNARDPENGTLSYSVDWGDSVPRVYTTNGTVASPSVQQTSTFTHSYSSAGTYTVKFTVTDDKGLVANTSSTVQVSTPSLTEAEIILNIAGVVKKCVGFVSHCLDFDVNGNGAITGADYLLVQQMATIDDARFITLRDKLFTAIGNRLYKNTGDELYEPLFDLDANGNVSNADLWKLKNAIVNSHPLPTASITVLSPNGGENWSLGQSQTIRWNSSSLTGNITVYVRYQDGDGGVCRVGTVPVSYGSFTFTPASNTPCSSGISQLVPGQYKVRLIGEGQSSTSDLGIYDDSNTNFTITSATGQPTLSASLQNTFTDRAGAWGNFGPGAGYGNKNTYDWNWSGARH
ncbi:MAG: peptidoglycan-binding protein [Candidatus Taylorbacteria bacterium]|nr:peptidoglycan-binding protein [Candidatus Taylorbacteria bacterium]